MNNKSLVNMINTTTPYAWDDSLGVYEFLGKIVSKLNEVVAEVNLKLPDGFELAFYEKFREYTREEMQRILDSGEFETILASILTGVNEIKDEVIEARGTNPTLRARLDADKAYFEIEPDDLRENETETDGDLLQKAIDLVNADNRKTKSIKLGRLYVIDKTINVGQTISYKNQPHIIITGANGGLKLAHDGYMFDGDNTAGGILFDKVKFEGTEEFKHSLINGTHLIQINFNQCQFYYTRTIIDSTDYLQSIRFTNCNFKGMKDYQIKSVMAYDMHLLNNIVEWGEGGFLLLTQESVDQYSDFGLFVKNNVIEGISDQIPINTKHLNRAVFDSNYFEGNSLTDMDLSGGSLPHRGLTITNNSFGSYVETDQKKANVKVGKLYGGQGYNFTSNTCIKTLFDFSDIGSGALIDLTGGKYTNGGSLNYVGAAPTRIGSYASKSEFDFSKPIFFTKTNNTSGTSNTVYIEMPRKGTYLMTTRALYEGNVNQAIHETVLLISEGGVGGYLWKTVSLSKKYITLDNTANDLSYVFEGAYNVGVTYTHPTASSTQLDITLIPLTNH